MQAGTRRHVATGRPPGRPKTSPAPPTGQVAYVKAWLDKALYDKLKLLLTARGETLQHWLEAHAEADTEVISPALLKRLQRS
jgi:hypothetical protein